LLPELKGRIAACSTSLIILARLSCMKLWREGNIREKISAGQKGTIVTVRNMFVGLPVRLAQMKKHRVSIGKVKSIIITYALVKEIRFYLQVRGNKRLDWSLEATSDALGVATSIYGRDLMQRYQNVSWSGEGITIEGIVPNSNEGLSELGTLI